MYKCKSSYLHKSFVINIFHFPVKPRKRVFTISNIKRVFSYILWLITNPKSRSDEVAKMKISDRNHIEMCQLRKF